jgi:hypothetical protein
VVGIADGQSHSLALKSDGTVAAWGSNLFGEATPPAGLSGVVGIAAGAWYGLALKSDGTVVGWGQNFSGQATPPAGLSTVVGIAAGNGGSHSLALKSDGTVVAWGDNTYGQATPPPGLSGVVGIAAGIYHSLALKSDGTVVGWGDNTYGQATPPPGLSGVVGIVAGNTHSLALMSNGTVVGWGYNYDGQATPPAGLSGVIGIAAAALHSLALIKGVPANLSLSPNSGFPGASITATGSGFATNETVALVYRQPSGWLVMAQGAADPTGTASMTARVPLAPYGPNLFYVTGRTSFRLGYALFSVASGIALIPDTGLVGATITVQGAGFGAGEAVDLYWSSPQQLLGTVTADSTGSFYQTTAFTFTIPSGVASGSNVIVGKGRTTRAVGRRYITVQ